MPTFTTETGREYRVDGKYLIWTPEVWEDEDPLPAVRLPLRIKLGVAMEAGRGAIGDNASMRAMLLALVPTAEPVLDDMDINDFRAMFETWTAVYAQMSGVSLGEASSSAGSSPSTAPQRSTTGARGSGSRSKK